MRAHDVRPQSGSFLIRHLARRGGGVRTIPRDAIAPGLDPELSTASMRILEVGLAIGAIAIAVLIGFIH